MTSASVERLLRDEYRMARLIALWRNSPQSRADVRDMLAALGINDPGQVAREMETEVGIRLFDLEGKYPDVAGAALEQCACVMGRRMWAGGGSRSCAVKLANSYFPNHRAALLSAWDAAAANPSEAPIETMSRAVEVHRRDD